MATSDLTIGAKRNLKYTVGETFWGKLIIVDKNNTHIDWTGATIGDMVISTLNGASVVLTVPSSAMDVNEDGDIEMRVDDGLEITGGYYGFKLALRPAGGGPKGYYKGKFIANDRY